jgi:hypothetical protein
MSTYFKLIDLIISFFQMALRLLAFKQIHKILGMESLQTNNALNSQAARTNRKRQYPSNGNDSQSKIAVT